MVVKVLAFLALGTVAVAVLGLWAFQRFGIYSFPETPAPAPPAGVEVFRVVSEDGQEIPVWVLRPEPGQPWLISFYGNAARFERSFTQMQAVQEAGLGLVMMQYRGTQGLPGTPSERDFAADARALYDQLDALVGETVPPEARVLHGFSLGAGVGSRLAANRPFAGVILHAAPDRTCQFYERRYRVLPLCRLMWRERYDIIDHVRGITAPLLVIHGQNDATVPVTEAESNFAAAPNPWGLRVLAGGHANLTDHGLIPEINAFVADVTGEITGDITGG